MKTMVNKISKKNIQYLAYV